MYRKDPIITGEIYHIFSRSIAGYKIFNDTLDYSRMKQMLRFYQVDGMPCKFSHFAKMHDAKTEGFHKSLMEIAKAKPRRTHIIAYAIMPTHLHLALKQLISNGISAYMGNLLNSYAKYFNNRHKRRGPLWESRFKNVRVQTDEQLLHLTRYIHLNPATAYLVDQPEDWEESSYGEYLETINADERCCDYENLLDIKTSEYKKFVDDQIDYQRKLDHIKHLLIE